MYYKALGFVVWKLGTRYLRRRYGTAPKKIGAGALVAVGVAGAIVVAQKRLGADSSG
ncbi:hypothetical protein [Conexibacter woesei]|uniref:Uncharacterized protein n=1 Tax=Conexibacter woesei (strain DSM 14684 / CCUG 47730 / CIP 108061 / JCM 11494 / NBRC 100937 / ID131577) TaxID=469383 RepID=D3F0G6_CONWI|nr:hypothetical protein [Conexibacter woesei]ADB52026.1 hypothetical protein Cwoe_3609 [Conexibacter woesei DSM 14684]